MAGKYRGIIARLPQPGANVLRPETVTVHAQVAGNLVGRSEPGDGRVPLTQNGVCSLFAHSFFFIFLLFLFLFTLMILYMYLDKLPKRILADQETDQCQ
jgi:hypothetical protein